MKTHSLGTVNPRYNEVNGTVKKFYIRGNLIKATSP